MFLMVENKAITSRLPITNSVWGPDRPLGRPIQEMLRKRSVQDADLVLSYMKFSYSRMWPDAPVQKCLHWITFHSMLFLLRSAFDALHGAHISIFLSPFRICLSTAQSSQHLCSMCVTRLSLAAYLQNSSMLPLCSSQLNCRVQPEDIPLPPFFSRQPCTHFARDSSSL